MDRRALASGPVHLQIAARYGSISLATDADAEWSIRIVFGPAFGCRPLSINEIA